MKRRFVLALTAAAFIAGGAGAASAAGHGNTPTVSSDKQHQLCVLFYHDDGRPPTPVCVNW
jgi:hypothetical protein